MPTYPASHTNDCEYCKLAAHIRVEHELVKQRLAHERSLNDNTADGIARFNREMSIANELFIFTSRMDQQLDITHSRKVW